MLIIIRSPYTLAWNLILARSGQRSEMEQLRCLFTLNDDFLEEYHFSILHKTVLGINCLDLGEQLTLHRDDINATDVNGRTPLIWAALRGDSCAVKRLLEAKADLDIIPTKPGPTAIAAAAVSGSVACMKLLLDAGANANLLSNYLKSNALHYAAQFQNSEEIVKLLIAVGTDCGARNCYGGEPLVNTAIHDHDIAAAALLDSGADIDCMDNEGDNPLLSSVYQNSDKVTKLLLSRGATYTSWLSTGDSILHVAAKCGGSKTIELLLAARLHGVDPDAVNREKKTTLQIAQERKGTEEGFVGKVQDLLADIRARNTTYESTIPEPTDPSEESAWLLHTWTQFKGFSFNPFRPRRLQDRHHPQYQRLMWTRWLLVGSCILGFVWIYKRLEPGTFSSLATLIWNMIDPGDLDDL